MSPENNNSRNIDVSNIIDSIANAMVPASSTARIHRVPTMVREREDYEKYYVPKVVSIGPYHYGNPKLEFVEKLKPVFTMKLLGDNRETLGSLCKTLGEPKMVQELKDFYEEKSISHFNDEVFTMMMLQDGCFILYCIRYILGNIANYVGLNNQQIVYVYQDLLLLENQIPFVVLKEVSELLGNWTFLEILIKLLVEDNIFSPRPERRQFCFRIDRAKQNSISDLRSSQADHLLHFLYLTLTREPTRNHVPNVDSIWFSRNGARNVSELMDAGIHFTPSNTMSLARVEFSRGWWLMNVKLPPITVDETTKPTLLNLIAYETCPRKVPLSWVTSYIGLLGSLIDHPGDVKALREAGVLKTSLGSDHEVAKMFKEISSELVPNDLAYLNTMIQMQEHYVRWSSVNRSLSQLKHDYIPNPWAFLAVVGAILALFLTAVQTYFTVWNPNGECDDLCKFLKINHHL